MGTVLKPARNEFDFWPESSGKINELEKQKKLTYKTSTNVGRGYDRCGDWASFWGITA